MPLAALSKNLWKRFIEVRDSSRQFGSIIWYGHPESTLICFYPLETEQSPLSFLLLLLMKKAKPSVKASCHYSYCDISHQRISSYITNLGKIRVFCYYFCTLYLQTLNKIILVFSGKAYGVLWCWTVIDSIQGTEVKARANTSQLHRRNTD